MCGSKNLQINQICVEFHEIHLEILEQFAKSTIVLLGDPQEECIISNDTCRSQVYNSIFDFHNKESEGIEISD